MERQELLEQLRKLCKEQKMTQKELAALAGISEVYFSYLMKGKRQMSEELRAKMEEMVFKYSNYKPEIMLDYCRIRFPTQDIRYVIEEVLRIQIKYFGHEEKGFYGYSDIYMLGNVFVMTSPDKKKGTLLELKGKGCRQFECYLKAQGRNWYQFLCQCKNGNAKMKRIDLAINDKVGILDISWLVEKWKKGEYVSVFRYFDCHESGIDIPERDKKEKEMGKTFYCGSMKSEIYFCIYEKDYEQYMRLGIPVEEASIKNRFEIRLKNERAELAVENLIRHENPGNTVFGIINHYLRFVEKVEEEKLRKDWKTDNKWQRFIGAEERNIRLTVKPEPYVFDKTMRWFAKQVAPMWKSAVEIDKRNHTNKMEHMLEKTELKEHHKKLIEQQTTEIRDIIC